MGLKNVFKKILQKAPPQELPSSDVPEEEKAINPFITARKEYEDRYGSAIKDAAKWRRHCAILMLICVMFAGGVVWLAAQNKVVPYIVQIDKHGYAISIKSAEEGSVADERVVVATMGRVIMDMRTVVTDPKAQEKLISGVYACIAKESAAETFVNAYYNENNPYTMVKHKGQGRFVNITSITPFIAGGGKNSSWLVLWTEQTTQEGRVIGVSTYRAIVKIAISPVRDLDQVLINPLGVYFTDINVTKDIS